MEVCHTEANTLAKSTQQKSSTGSSCKLASHLPPRLVADQRPPNHSFVPTLSQEVFERPIPAPDFDIAQLWEEVRNKVVLIEQSSELASGVMSYLPGTTEPAELFPPNPKLQIPVISTLDSSRLAIELRIEDISGIPQFTSGYPTNQKKTEDVRDSSFIDDSSTFELFERIVLGYSAAADGKLEVKLAPQAPSPDEEPLDHIRPKLHHLRFKDSSRKDRYVQRRQISLDISATFASVNYKDILEPSLILGPDNIGATFLSIFGSKYGDGLFGNLSPELEQEARSMLSKQLRLHYPALDNAQKRALVQNLRHFVYLVERNVVMVFVIHIQTLDPAPSASFIRLTNVKSRAAKSLQGLKQQPASSGCREQATSDKQLSTLLAQPTRRPPSARNTKAFPSNSNSASGPKSVTVNNAQAPSRQPSTSMAALHAVSPERFLEIVPCAARIVGYFDLSKAEELQKFSDLNVIIMKWGQAKYGMALAENLHKLRMESKDPVDWQMDEKELREYWRNVVNFKWQDDRIGSR